MKKRSLSQKRQPQATQSSSEDTPNGTQHETLRFLPPVDWSLLTQTMRRDRTRPGPEPETWRAALRKIRETWKACRQLIGLTVFSLREHLATNLQTLPIEETSRSHLLELLKSFPDDVSFWQAVEDANRLVRDTEENGECPSDDYWNVWNGQYFRARFTGQPEAISQVWEQSGLEVLSILHVLRTRANWYVRERSYLLRHYWEQGKDWGLLAAVQEELSTRWVKEELAKLQQQATVGKTPEEQERAKRFLEDVENARSAIGKGNREHLSAEEKPKTQREAVARSKAVRRLMKRQESEVASGGNPKITALGIAIEYKKDSRIKNPSQISHIINTFLKRAGLQ